MSDAAYIPPSDREPGPWGKRFSVHEVEESQKVVTNGLQYPNCNPWVTGTDRGETNE